MVLKAAEIQAFNGLKTDCPASKCPADYSPDCSDMVFTTQGTATRPPFVVVERLPADVVFCEDFTSKDGSAQRVAMTSDGRLYASANGGSYSQIDIVTPASQCNATVAYGRIYMAFFNDQGGCDIPRQWDGTKMYRVSQDGPGAAPKIANMAYPAAALAGGLTRLDNTVTGTTAAAHNLLVGYQGLVAGVAASQIGGGVSRVVINNEDLPGIATITTNAAHGLLPDNNVFLDAIPSNNFAVISFSYSNGVAIVQTNAPHGLSVGSSIMCQLGGGGLLGPVIVSQVTAPDIFITTTTAPGSLSGGSGGQVQYLFPLANSYGSPATPAVLNTNAFTVISSPTTTTFQVAFAYTDGTWLGGTVSFPWDGAFYVTSIPTPTTFTYQQYGPNTATASAGTITPNGQVGPGLHKYVWLFQTETGFITAPGPVLTLTANGGQYLAVTDAPIGPPNTKRRILAGTGASGSAYAYLLVPPQVNGLIVGTASIIDDNISTSAVFDFSDTSLLSNAFGRIDVPGNFLFRQVALNTPKGFDFYQSRLTSYGNLNEVFNLVNLKFDGGYSASAPNVPSAWTVAGTGILINNATYGQSWQVEDASTIEQGAFQDRNGLPILAPKTLYTFRVKATGAGNIVAHLISPISGLIATATVPVTGNFSQADFDSMTGVHIPADTVLRVFADSASSGSPVTMDEFELIYTQNPYMNPVARMSYATNPEAYDGVTGNIGPADDNTEIRTTFVLQESIHFVTAKKLYGFSQIGNAEPSSWEPIQISDKCGAFGPNSSVTGKGWAAWGGTHGAFWFSGGLPRKISNNIAPTWKAVTGLTSVTDDAVAQRVYFCRAGSTPLVYDYHEAEMGGTYKWCPWSRHVLYASESTQGALFCIGGTIYRLDTAAGLVDEGLGDIGGYYTLAPFASSIFLKDFSNLGLRISGTGILSPFCYTKSLGTLTRTLRAQDLAALLDTVAEWPENISGRLLFVKLGQPGAQFSLEDVACTYQLDPNKPVAGVR